MTQLGEFSEQQVLSAARTAYDRGQADAPLCVGSVALLVVDMLDEFAKPHWSPYWIPNATAQAPDIRRVQDACRKLTVPVINIGYETSLMGTNFPPWLPAVPIGKGLSEYVGQLFTKVSFYEPVAPQPGDLVLLKHAYSAFHETPLETVLRNLGVDTVIICGTVTNFCCGATAREAFWHGFKVVFGSDINSSDDEECQRAELKTLRRGYARILTSAEIIQELQESMAATHS